MIIYLDFDGTVVEHEYPKMGRCNFGCFEIIAKFQQAGHQIILNTYRADCQDDTLQKALDYLNNHPRHEIAPITEYLPSKVHAPRWDLPYFIEKGMIFIDDQSYGIPLKPAVMAQGWMVDWAMLDLQFKKHSLYSAQKC